MQRMHCSQRSNKIALWCIAPIVLSISSAHAANMYICKDKDGNSLLTNISCKNTNRSNNNFSSYTQTEKVTWYKDTNVHTYTNWGSSEASVLPSYSKNKNAYDNLIQAAAARNGVEHGLLKAMMHTESGFNPNARSPVGAQGLMQLMPATARRFGVNDPWNPEQNIEGGAKYISWLMRRYNNLEKTVAAYNAGEGNVDKYGGIPPFRETRDYVKRVLSRYNNLYSGGALSAAANPVSTANPSNERPITLAALSMDKAE